MVLVGWLVREVLGNDTEVFEEEAEEVLDSVFVFLFCFLFLSFFFLLLSFSPWSLCFSLGALLLSCLHLGVEFCLFFLLLVFF